MAETIGDGRRPRGVRAGVVAALAGVVLALSSAVVPGTAAALPPPERGYGSYSLQFFLAGIPAFEADDVMAELNRDFDRYFTFAGCGTSIRVGQVCQLRAPGITAPVEVVAVERQGFSFKSLPGHPEGADRFINFQFRAADTTDNATLKEMSVDAWGPVSNASIAGPLNAKTVAAGSWQAFANNINDRFPDEPVIRGGTI